MQILSQWVESLSHYKPFIVGLHSAQLVDDTYKALLHDVFMSLPLELPSLSWPHIVNQKQCHHADYSLWTELMNSFHSHRNALLDQVLMCKTDELFHAGLHNWEQQCCFADYVGPSSTLSARNDLHTMNSSWNCYPACSKSLPASLLMTQRHNKLWSLITHGISTLLWPSLTISFGFWSTTKLGLLHTMMNSLFMCCQKKSKLWPCCGFSMKFPSMRILYAAYIAWTQQWWCIISCLQDHKATGNPLNFLKLFKK